MSPATYAAAQLDGYGLAYLHLVDGLAFGFHERGTPKTLAPPADVKVRSAPTTEGYADFPFYPRR